MLDRIAAQAPIFKDSETTIKIKFSIFEGAGPWGQRGKSSKMLFFVGNATTIKFSKCKFYCRKILLSLRRLLHLHESPGAPGPKSQKSSKNSLFGGLQKNPGRNYIRPPPPSLPVFGHEAFFRGGGWGCIF